MERGCDLNLTRTLRLCRALMALADRGEAEAEDDGCLILYGELRDSAYRILKKVRQERKEHLKRVREVSG